jgi:Right handed beta helix region
MFIQKRFATHARCGIGVVMRMLSTILLVATMAASPAASGAAIQRTFVKSNGADTNPCTLAAPCRSFGKAISNTLSGGEVIVLDAAGYGPVTIAQSVSIIAPPGIYAGVTAAIGGGVAISGDGSIVVLQGLTINGTGGTVGIDLGANAEVHVVNCSIANMALSGIDAEADGGRLYVSDTLIRDNDGSGVRISGPIAATFVRVRIEGNALAGIDAADGARVSVHDSVISANAIFGVNVRASGATVTRADIGQSVLADNFAAGAIAFAQDAGSRATLDMYRSSSVRGGNESGVSASAVSGASAVLTVASSVLAGNFSFGIFASDDAVALANGNTISGNSGGGLSAAFGGTLHTRRNNAGEQSFPTSGTTPIAGF